MAPSTVEISSPNVRYTAEHIKAQYEYSTTEVERKANGRLVVHPKTTRYTFRTERRVPKLGLMLVGWGGNNGSTLTGAVLANRLGLCWHTKEGRRCPDWLGSVTQSSTLSLGMAPEGEVFVPMKDLLPMVDPNDLVIDGWDISSLNMADAMERAKVLDYDLQRQLRPHMEKLRPRPSIFLPDFVAANQAGRADNVLAGSKQSMMEKIRQDIRDFKAKSQVDKVIVLWTANTERFSEVRAGLNDTAENLLASIRRGESEVSPSTLFAVACVLEGVAYINGSPQNTFVPGLVQLAEQRNVFIGGDDFKSGQTKNPT